jgi:hypothetical protein
MTLYHDARMLTGHFLISGVEIMSTVLRIKQGVRGDTYSVKPIKQGPTMCL